MLGAGPLQLVVGLQMDQLRINPKALTSIQVIVIWPQLLLCSLWPLAHSTSGTLAVLSLPHPLRTLLSKNLTAPLPSAVHDIHMASCKALLKCHLL